MGYEFKTTFWQDFTIADCFGEAAVRDTFDRAFGEWKSDVVYVTELALVTNWRCWLHHDAGDDALSDLYAELYYKVRGWCLDNLKGDDIRYYFEVTD